MTRTLQWKRDRAVGRDGTEYMIVQRLFDAATGERAEEGWQLIVFPLGLGHNIERFNGTSRQTLKDMAQEIADEREGV